MHRVPLLSVCILAALCIGSVGAHEEFVSGVKFSCFPHLDIVCDLYLP